MATAVHLRLTSGEGRRFGLTVGVGLLGIRDGRLWRVRSTAAALPGSIGLVLAIAGILIPTRLAPVERAWMTLARATSFVTTRIVMALLYFGIISPSAYSAGRSPTIRLPVAKEERVLEGAGEGRSSKWSGSSTVLR